MLKMTLKTPLDSKIKPVKKLIALIITLQCTTAAALLACEMSAIVQ